MKNECDIIKDLLFSYNDNVLSKTSKEFVEEHLKDCEECKEVLEEIKKENELKKPLKEIDFFKRVRKKINKKNMIITVSVILLSIIVLFNLLVFKNYSEVASNMEIYLKDDITEEQLENIKNKVFELSDDIELEYISKEKSLEQMKNKLGNKSYILEDYESEKNPFPALVEIKTNTNLQRIVENIQEMPGIKHINTNSNYNPYLLFIYKFFQKD